MYYSGILSILSSLACKFFIVGIYASINAIILVYLMRFADKKQQRNKVAELLVKGIVYGVLFSLLLSLVIFIIKTYLSYLIPYALSRNNDGFTKLILNNTGAILTCITIPVSVVATLMAKPIGEAIENFINCTMSNKIDTCKNWFTRLMYTLMNTDFWWLVIIMAMGLVDSTP